ncbi:MAG: CoA-binding protein [Acidobacteria bacterium]|nr:CoA-binding protein [Acidobacteriota bacterium]
MTSRAAVSDFVGQQKLAIVGASRRKGKFGNMALKELRAKGYKLFPVHPEADMIEGQKCYRSFSALPEAVGGVLVVVPPAQAEKVVREAAEAGIRRVWLQQGAESPAAVRFCEENGMSVVHSECILMFAEPAAWFHRAHRWVWKLLGKLPQ